MRVKRARVKIQCLRAQAYIYIYRCLKEKNSNVLARHQLRIKYAYASVHAQPHSLFL